MSCKSLYLDDILDDCGNVAGGITDVWVANFDDFEYTIEADSSVNPGVVTAITRTDEDSSVNFKHWEFKEETGSFTSTANPNVQQGSNFYSNDVVLQFSRATAKKRLQMKSAVVTASTVIVRDVNNTMRVIGSDRPVRGNAATYTTGTAMTDFSGYNLTLHANETIEAPMILMTKENLAAVGINVKQAPVVD